MSVRPEKEKSALIAIHAVLVHARAMAADRVPYEQLVYALDSAEYLPALMLESGDSTDVFRATLCGLAKVYPDFAWALQKFDE